MPIPYRDLSREDFDEIIDDAFRWNCRAARPLRRLSASRSGESVACADGAAAGLAAITSGGAIPDNALYTVIAEPEGIVVGTVDEDFAVESLRGDIMLLGNTSWRIRRVQSGSVLVEDAKGAPPNVPFWRGEAPVANDGTFAAGRATCARQISALTDERSLPTVGVKLAASRSRGRMAARRMRAGSTPAPSKSWNTSSRAARCCGAVPTQKTIIAERFFDESGGMQLVIHAPFGGAHQ